MSVSNVKPLAVTQTQGSVPSAVSQPLDFFNTKGKKTDIKDLTFNGKATTLDELSKLEGKEAIKFLEQNNYSDNSQNTLVEAAFGFKVSQQEVESYIARLQQVAQAV